VKRGFGCLEVGVVITLTGLTTGFGSILTRLLFAIKAPGPKGSLATKLETNDFAFRSSAGSISLIF
jgi:hypothetical protein